ncbi:MAG: molybdopterin-dependent oxidoreductase [Desulfovermiculus sp.]
MTNSIPEIEDTECIMVIGSNTTSQHPMIASRMIRAQEKGAGLIVIDPRAIALTKYSDLFLKLRPGTNVALINGMLKVLIEHDLIDREFIAKRTEDFDALQAKVQEYPLERVSRITGLSEEQIEKAALMYGRADKAMIVYAMGITQQTAATENVQASVWAAGNAWRPVRCRP